MINRITLQTLTLLFLTAILCSCVSLSKEYPQKKLFTLDPERQAPVATRQDNGILIVRAFTASPACADAKFFLRQEDNRVEKDYYNNFVVVPSGLIQDQTAEWLRESGLFADVRLIPDIGEGLWGMTGNLLKLEGDFSQDTPEAVVSVQYIFGPAAKQEGTRFFQTYEERAPLDSSSPEALVQGWNTAFAAILTKLETDLANHLRSQPATTE